MPDNDDRAARLRQARAKYYKSARGAAEKFGWKVSTYAAHENGQNDYGPDAAAVYAKAFKTSAAWLLTGQGSEEGIDRSVAVMGRIGAGAEVSPEFEQVPPDGLFQIEADLPLAEGMIGFEVIGDSMAPRYDEGDVVICSEAGTSPLNIRQGAEAAVRTASGKRYVKLLFQTDRPDIYTLASHNGGLIHNVQILWASKITTVIRAGEWREIAQPKMMAPKKRGLRANRL